MRAHPWYVASTTAYWKPPGYARFRWSWQFLDLSDAFVPGPMYVWNWSKPHVITCLGLVGVVVVKWERMGRLWWMLKV